MMVPCRSISLAYSMTKVVEKGKQKYAKKNMLFQIYIQMEKFKSFFTCTVCAKVERVA